MTPSERSSDRYLADFFIAEEGDASFHEYVHFIQYAGTTFGAFRMIAFQITVKAMRIGLRKLIEAHRLKLPIGVDILDGLDSDEVRETTQRAIQYRLLIERYELSNWNILQATRMSNASFYNGSPPDPPVLLISPRTGYVIGHLAISEFHNLLVDRMKGREALAGPTEKWMWTKTVNLLGDGIERQLAWLCDWSLMPPNPNAVTTAPGECHPGWRFVKGIELLESKHGQKILTKSSYEAFTISMANYLGWHPPETIMSHYVLLINLAKDLSNNLSDAKRNRQIYSGIFKILSTAYSIRDDRPEAFALPHKYFTVLTQKLTLPLKKKDKHLIGLSGVDKQWLRTYIANVSLVRQAFFEKTIQCVYRDLHITDDCAHIHKEISEGRKCYTFPGPKSDTIQCGFLKLCLKLGL